MSTLLGKLNGYDPQSGAFSGTGSKAPFAVFYSNIDDTNYTDFSSIMNWWNYGQNVGVDYKFIRDRISDFVPTIQHTSDPQWIALTDDEKFIVASNKCAGQEISTEYLGTDAAYWMNIFDMKSQACRQQRYSNAKSLLINNTDLPSQYQVLTIIQQYKLDLQYLTYGLEGTMDGDLTEGLFNFVEATPLSSYGGQTVDQTGHPLGQFESIGIASMSMGFATYSPFYGLNTSPSSQSVIVTMMMNVLRLGIYS